MGAITGAFVHLFNSEYIWEDQNLRTLEKLTSELDRVSGMNRETFEREISGVKYASEDAYLDSKLNLEKELLAQIKKNLLAIGLDDSYQFQFGKGITGAIDTLYNILGPYKNYQVGYVCVPFRVCHSAGVYYEK